MIIIYEANELIGRSPGFPVKPGSETDFHKLLVGAGVDIYDKDFDGWDSLGDVVWAGEVDLAVVLLKASPDLATIKDWCSPIHFAAEFGHVELAQCLIDAGACVDERGYEGRTPLIEAVGEGDFEVTSCLISAGAHVNAADQTGSTALHRLATFGFSKRRQQKIANLLIQHGADVGARDDSGATPIHLALAFGHTNYAQVLIDAGADLEAQDNEGETPMDIARKEGNEVVIGFISKHRATQLDERLPAATAEGQGLGRF